MVAVPYRRGQNFVPLWKQEEDKRKASEEKSRRLPTREIKSFGSLEGEEVPEVPVSPVPAPAPKPIFPLVAGFLDRLMGKSSFGDSCSGRYGYNQRNRRF